MVWGGISPWLSEVEVRRCGLPSLNNVLRDSIDKDIHHEITGQRKAMKTWDKEKLWNI